MLGEQVLALGNLLQDFLISGMRLLSATKVISGISVLENMVWWSHQSCSSGPVAQD
jgi:hypothetical protein